MSLASAPHNVSVTGASTDGSMTARSRLRSVCSLSFLGTARTVPGSATRTKIETFASPVAVPSAANGVQRNGIAIVGRVKRRPPWTVVSDVCRPAVTCTSNRLVVSAPAKAPGARGRARGRMSALEIEMTSPKARASLNCWRLSDQMTMRIVPESSLAVSERTNR